MHAAIAEEEKKSPAMSYGNIHNTPLSIDKLIRKLKSSGHELNVVYEAGPTGYGIYRQLKSQNIECAVITPSLIPKKSGDRVKTDRRDAMNLARLHRSDDLTQIHVPNEEDEAIRDLTRAREDARICAKKAKQRLNSFLLRNNTIYSGKTRWNKTHLAWLSEVSMIIAVTTLAESTYLRQSRRLVL
ncbi:MAG: transposase [Desulfobacter sp.]|nr:MAG: transposase [Desulfobacter sp.]